MAEGDTFANALLGAVVIVLTTPVIPFAPLAGGAIAGYLQGRDSEEGVTVGAIAGLISLVPLVAGLVLIGNVFFFLLAAGGTGISTAVGSFGIAIVLSLFVGLLVYVVLLSALGGWVGSYVKAERLI